MLEREVVATIGLCLDIVGGLFVAVEAVKLQNLSRFRKWLEGTRRFLPDLSDAPASPEREHDEDVGLRIIVVVGIVAWMITCRIYFGRFVYFYTGLGTGHAHISWHNFLVGTLLGLAVGAIVALASIAVVLPLLAIFVRGLESMEKNTPSGAVGIIGAGLLIAGFGLDLAATWME
jgi:hypothetical protein